MEDRAGLNTVHLDDLATTKEAALKLMETTYVLAEAFSAADLRHESIAMLGHDFPVISIIPPGKARARVRKLAKSL